MRSRHGPARRCRRAGPSSRCRIRIGSRVPGTGTLRFIEVKGRVSGASTVTVTRTRTRNEILYSLNKPDDFILGIVEFLDDGTHRVHYVREPFKREPDFGVTSVNYDIRSCWREGRRRHDRGARTSIGWRPAGTSG